MKAAYFVIRYNYPGTTNGTPVGLVYVLDINDLSPGCWSYSKTPATATQWPTFEAAFRELQRHRWREAEVIKIERGA